MKHEDDALDAFASLLSGDYFFLMVRGSGKMWLQNAVKNEMMKRRGIIMKESFELNAVKAEMINMLTYDCRGAAIDMLADILLLANRDNAVSVCDIFGLNHKSIDRSWDQYGWTAEDIIVPGTLVISKEDGKYRVLPNFSLMKRLDRELLVCRGTKSGVQYCDEVNSYPSWNDICNKPIVKKEVLNEKPKTHHEYGISGDSSYHVGRQQDGTLGKNDYLSYSVHVNTTNPKVYHEIFDLAESLITEAQNEEEED